MISRYQVDNSNYQGKLSLRRYFMAKYHSESPASVMDCCQGAGLVWKQLRSEFTLSSYFGMDLKKKKGRLKVDSVQVLSQPGWKQDIIDVDTYGQPWRHWEAIVRNATHPLTVFMTIGRGVGLLTSIDHRSLYLIGFSKRLVNMVPKALKRQNIFDDLVLNQYLTMSYDHAIIECMEVRQGRQFETRYIGVRIQPKKHLADVSCEASRTTRSVKETEHV